MTILPFNTTIEGVCPQCGKEFQYLKHGSGRNKLYCSPSCRGRAHYLRSRVWFKKTGRRAMKMLEVESNA